MSSLALRIYFAFALVALTATAWFGARAPHSNETPRTHVEALPTPPSRAEPHAYEGVATWPSAIDWIAAGGGPMPELNQISLEDDLDLAADVFGRERGIVLYAAGPETSAVQVLDPERRGDELRNTLADFFDARAGRDSHYAHVRIRVHGAATRQSVFDAMRRAFTGAEADALLYLAGHGDGGDRPSDVSLIMWGDEVVRPQDLALALAEAPIGARVRVVVTSCYSGGFGQIAFRNADEQQNAVDADVCGFFAAPWDAQASGCDRNPDRGQHEGYGVHFLHALRSEAKDGRPLAASDVDFDSDGRVSLLEAHTRALIASASLDVPTTTSQTFLRAAAPKLGPSPRGTFGMPENDAVLVTLSARLGLAGREESAREELRTREAMMDTLEAEAATAAENEARAYAVAAASLLARYPVLDDPWHPDFDETLREHAEEIQSFFDTSSEIAALERAQTIVANVADRSEILIVDTAPYRRLVRALDDRVLASRLELLGGSTWERYRRFVACERSAPP